jgi:hypothetical protein
VLSVEDQIHRYGDYLEGESLRGVELAVETAEVQPGISRLAVAALLVLVAGVVAFAAVSLGSREQGEQGEPADTATAATASISSQEQMALDHSDGIALEVVGDELWILGNGFGNPTVQPPFSIYVTGEQGKLLRTIDLGRHFGQMGQSASYVWLLADGTKSENPPVEPEVIRINKRTGEVDRVDWFYPYKPVAAAVYSDDGFWFTVEDGFRVRKWSFASMSLSTNFGNDDGILALEVQGQSLIMATGDGQMWLTSLDTQAGYSGLTRDDSEVIAIESDGEVLWALRVDGHISSFDEELEEGNVYQCRGATHLAALPGGGVIASDGFNLCEVGVGGINFRSESETSQWPVDDTAVFGGQLWYATTSVAERISEPLPR